MGTLRPARPACILPRGLKVVPCMSSACMPAAAQPCTKHRVKASDWITVQEACLTPLYECLLQPFGKIPVLEDPELGITIFESRAILRCDTKRCSTGHLFSSAVPHQTGVMADAELAGTMCALLTLSRTPSAVPPHAC